MFHEGQQIGPYTLIRRLGKGGFGDVWLAERRSQFLTKRVAVKLPHDDQVDFNTIQREAGLWEEASGHPNVLPIIDAEVYDGHVVIVSEYADGGSLADRLTDLGTTSVKEAVDLTMGILSGLEFLHRKRIIHRDIKPQNILIQGDTPRLADFGISRAMATSAVSSTIIGTDAYMSPEAFDGKRTEATDIWSTGVVLYQLLNGTLPFPQTHPTERMFAVLTKDFEPLADTVPADLRQIVATALAKLPENRFKSAAAMREALAQAKVRIDHPTFANTEVFDRSVMPVPSLPTNTDPEVTIIRVQIPEQETFVRTAETVPAASTQLAFSDRTGHLPPTPSRAHPESPMPTYDEVSRSGFLADNPLVGVLGISLLAIGGLLFLAFLGASMSPSTSNNTFKNTNYKSPTPSLTSMTNKPANSSTNTYSSNSTYNSNTSSSNSNTYSSNSNAPNPETPFCKAYIEAWDAEWKKVNGASFTPPRAKCPPADDPSDAKDGKKSGWADAYLAARTVH